MSEFLLLGLSREPQQQQLLFVLFLTMYLASVLGNLLILLAISTDNRLHTPMYFFLSNLSFVDICFSSTSVPNVPAKHMLGSQAISFNSCLMHMYFLIIFAVMENLFLAVMAYDHFVAIWHLLHYTRKMTHQLCAVVLAGSWVAKNLNLLLHTLLMAQLSFCADIVIPHFFCHVPIFLGLSCSETQLNDAMIVSEGALIMIIHLSASWPPTCA
ncbi:Olfactory receptor 1F1 [Fukomys damarensis]|uniref:Olfactory receptor 1F1 n=1 Tax=Fukomys damarensis TaxID=885580 RepID=A0A091DPP5_FUKDA|nr:Olfactory receptor 1F1 [Fukomys damarensis]